MRHPVGRNDHTCSSELVESFEEAGLGWFWATDAQGRLTYLSEGACGQLECGAGPAVGQQLSEIFVVDPEFERSGSEAHHRTLAFLMSSRVSITQLAVKCASVTKEISWEITGRPTFDRGGRFIGYRGSASDVTDARAREREAQRLSQFDALTGLANRDRFYERLGVTLTSFRNFKRSCSLMVVGLHRFKQVNEALGHQAGDEVLKHVATRLKQAVGGAGEIARLGGDEFLVMLPDIDDRGRLGDLAEEIIQLVSQPYSIEGARAIINLSVGIATAPYDGVDRAELLKATNIAFNASKGARARYRFYSSELQDQVGQRRQIEEDLRDAIATGIGLAMHYQPIVDARTHQLKCLEALMRWDDPERGEISPGLFIPIAEETGLIRQIGTWALEEACRQAQQWPGDLRVAINVSAIQFMDGKFVDTVETALRKSGIAPARVELEITESVFMADQAYTQRIFKALKSLGVRLALDDFGTGYSSLSYLSKAPFDKIKIDQSFVRGATEPGNNNAAIISSVVSLALALNMETVAEGVETQDELELVTGKGASHIQGRLFSFAVSQQELLDKIASGDLVYEPEGPARQRADRRSEYRRVGLVHDDHRYIVVLRNLSKTGALIEGLLDVPVGTEVVLDLGDGQLAVATVQRSSEFRQGVEFETPLISDGADGLCTRYRVSPYLIEAAGRPLAALPDDPYAALTGQDAAKAKLMRPKFFREVDRDSRRTHAA